MSDPLPGEPYRKLGSLSVVIPLHNEAGNVRELHAQLLRVLRGLGCAWEICYVDDGSTDATYEELCRAVDTNEPIQIIRLTRRFGQSAALRAGIDATTGDIVVTLDGDLQNDPCDIPRFLEKIREGYDVVHGWRIHRHDAFFTRRLPSLVANALLRSLLDSPTPDLGCGIRAMRRWVADHLELVGDMHRFLAILAEALGAKSAVIPVNHRPRPAGKSKYGLRRIFAVLADIPLLFFLAHFRWKPMRLMSLLSALVALLGLFMALPGLVWTVLGRLTLGVPCIAATVVSWAISALFLAMGFFSELVLRVGLNMGVMSPYIVRQTSGGSGGKHIVLFPAAPTDIADPPKTEPYGKTGS